MIARILLTGAAAGFLGWGLENLLVGERYSEVFGPGNVIPFLPVYAFGGATLAALTPILGGASWPVRGLVYGGTMAAIEAVAGGLERNEGRMSWDYNGAAVDVEHAALWGALCLGAEAALGYLGGENSK